MSSKTKILGPDGKQHDAEMVPIEGVTVKGTEIRLADGSRLLATLNVQKVHRLKGLQDESGDPVYFMTSTNNLVVVAGPQSKLKEV